MKQKAHAWVALRALKLIDDHKTAPKFIELMSYYLSDAWEGAWLPDTLIRDMMYGHIFKLDDDPKYLGYDITVRDWRKLTYSSLKRGLSGKRLCLQYVKDAPVLRHPYWVHETASGHLPDRVIALSHSIADMLKMSDYPMAFYVQKKRSKIYMKENLSDMKVKDLTLSPNFSARQIALSFFIMSHYICDAHMPLHCDLRDYGSGSKRRLNRKLHPSIEAKWEKQFPSEEDIILHDYAKKSLKDVVIGRIPEDSIIKIDTSSKYPFGKRLTKMKYNEWDEMVNICRTSFAVSRKWIDDDHKTADDIDDSIFEEVTNYIFHDAVEAVARIWMKAWDRFVE